MEDQNDDQSVASQADPASHPHNTAFQLLAQFMEMKFDGDSNCVMNLTGLCQKFKQLLGEECVIVSSYKSHMIFWSLEFIVILETDWHSTVLESITELSMSSAP